MGDQGAPSTIHIPKLPFKHESVSDKSLQNNTFVFEELTGLKFPEFLSRNVISALSCTGNIQQLDSLLCIDIPYFWCNYCSYKTIQKSEMIDHMQCHRFHCQFCEFSAFTRCEILKHSMNNHPNKTNFGLFWLCVLNCDQNLVGHNSENIREAPAVSSKRSREPESKKQNEVMLLKKIKLEKPDGELLETSVEVPNSKQNHLALNPTVVSDPDGSENIPRYRNILSQISDEMNGLSSHAEPSDTVIPQVATKQPKNHTESTTNQNSYLRTILTTGDGTTPSDRVTEKNGLDIENKASEHHFPVEPVVKIEVIEDPFVDNQASNSKVIEDKSVTTLSGKDDINRSKSSTPDPTNLPILRTMLLCSEALSSSTASSVSGDGGEEGAKKQNSLKSHLSDDSEYDTDNNDDDNDADYLPTKNDSSGEEWSYTTKSKGKKRKNWPVYSCPNCSVNKASFKLTKSHLFRVHPKSNLVLREDSSNTYVFICPSDKCTFRHTEFKTFVRHLEKCDVFTKTKFIDTAERNMLNTLLVTFKNILERSKSKWTYACCLCAIKFTNLSSALSHVHRNNATCPLSDCLFKFRNKAVLMFCKHCETEVFVSQWSALLNKNCKQHKISDLNLTLDQTPPATKSIPSASTSQPPSKADSTPQLRAMLQRKGEHNTDADRTRGESPDNENLPASRMLQWLISEGSRMMHMLK